MRIAFLRKIALVALLLALVAGAASAFNLPKKTIKGTEYYYYKVKKGESLYGISKELGITPELIIEHNPTAAGGVRKGDMLLFPVAEFAEPDDEPAIHDQLAPDTIAEEPALPVVEKKPILAVLLPFGLDKKEPSKLNTLALDFYKGVLIAADSLSNRAPKMEIVARDTEGLTPEAIAALLVSDPLLASAAVIIPPDNDTSLAAIARKAAEQGTYVLNVLNMRDSLYLDNPYVMQANVPQHDMYRMAVDGLLREYPGYTPVILNSEEGRREKEQFTAYLAERYTALGVQPVTITYKSNLLMADLETLPVDAGQKYVFIPSSGSLQEFNRFAYVLRSFRDLLAGRGAETETDAPIAAAEIFGYPDWTAFRGDALDMLHRLNATVYSRFFDDFNGFNARTLDSDFRRWYGASMLESIPSYGILGYDSASMIIKNLRANDGTFDPLLPRSYEGIQSVFDFRRERCGLVNSSLYIINYQPGGRVSARLQ